MLKRFQNKVGESRYTLTFMVVYGLLIWYLAGAVQQRLIMQFIMAILSTYLMVELNNSNALIRIYSRTVSSSFIALSTMAVFLLPSIQVWVTVLCVISFYSIFFHTYQDNHAPGMVFYAFLCIGFASIVFVHILYFVPILWILMKRNLMAFSASMFWASILGIIAPYWFIAPYLLWKGSIENLVTHFAKLGEFQPLFQYQDIDIHRWVTLGFTLFVFLIGAIHYLRNSYLDKIRTRMLYLIFLIMNVLCIIFLALQPQHFDVLLGLIIINTSAVFAHFIALTHTKATNIMFIVLIVINLLITIFNLWMPSLPF